MNIVTEDVVAQMLPGAKRSTIHDMYPLMIDALAERGVADLDMALYAFATINPETSAALPIAEIGGSKARYAPYYGRGYVQLTWFDNYKKAGKALGLDLVNNPDLAMEPRNAARIMAWFLTSEGREERLRKAFANNDIAAMRKVVNGGTNGINKFSTSWNIGNKLTGR
ncbi:MAG TPA: glycoside hydrolase family 19 protein [Candidatus Saccharimonadales bacterium]|nr:glycoside hydrolase family 19 protein [Candidatus Saccharimonadales bacterium]